MTYKWPSTPLHSTLAGVSVDEEPDDASGVSSPAGDDAPSGPTFQRVQLSLPPPQPKLDSSSQGLSAAAVKALSKLLSQCGLPPIATGEGEQPGDASGKLSTFLPEAAEVRGSSRRRVGRVCASRMTMFQVRSAAAMQQLLLS
jgi:hypothetical protein